MKPVDPTVPVAASLRANSLPDLAISTGLKSGPSELPPKDENGSGSTTAAVAASGDQRIDGLLSGVKWANSIITYSDPDSAADYQASHPEAFSNFQQISASQLAVVHAVLNQAVYTQPSGATGFSVEGFTNLFIDYAGSDTGASTIRLANTSNPSTAYAYYPSNEVYRGRRLLRQLRPLPHRRQLRLSHGHSRARSLARAEARTGNRRLRRASVELRFARIQRHDLPDVIGDNGSGYDYETWGAPQTFMMLDIAALQHMYGADFGNNAGNTTYTWNPTTGATFVDGASPSSRAPTGSSRPSGTATASTPTTCRTTPPTSASTSTPAPTPPSPAPSARSSAAARTAATPAATCSMRCNTTATPLADRECHRRNGQ